jgi:bifunctional non-homologous end joining protein LigD
MWEKRHSMEKMIGSGRYSFTASSLEKKMYPESDITKEDVVDYYLKISGYMLSHISDRPVTMHRYPDGITGKDFYHKEAPDYFPGWIERVRISLEKGEEQEQILCQNKLSLAYIADQGCIVPHIWLSRKDRLRYPDKLIFDLDPPGDDFSEVVFAAMKLREILEGVGLLPFVMNTGSSGLHVVVPIKREKTFDDVRSFAEKVSESASEQFPDRLTTKKRKNERKGRIFVDYLRNAYGQTSVAPYAPRAIEGAPVATPLDWDEVRENIGPGRYTISNIMRRLGAKGDPWSDFGRHARSIDSAIKEL